VPGGDGAQLFCGAGPAAVAVSLDNATLRVTRSRIYGGQFNGAQAVALASSGGSVVADPTVQFAAAPSGVVTAFVPAMAGQSSAGGASMQYRADALPQIGVLTFASLGLQPPVATSVGPAWIDLSHTVLLAVGVTDNGGTFAGSLSVPAGTQRGLVVVIQSALLPPEGPVASTPGLLTVL
jgi:hypothetical protein